jgi:hypothetical protein
LKAAYEVARATHDGPVIGCSSLSLSVSQIIRIGFVVSFYYQTLSNSGNQPYADIGVNISGGDSDLKKAMVLLPVTAIVFDPFVNVLIALTQSTQDVAVSMAKYSRECLSSCSRGGLFGRCSQPGASAGAGVEAAAAASASAPAAV